MTVSDLKTRPYCIDGCAGSHSLVLVTFFFNSLSWAEYPWLKAGGVLPSEQKCSSDNRVLASRVPLPTEASRSQHILAWQV